MANILFLDFDGVINIPYWSYKKGKLECDFNMPWDNKVNDFQAIQWVSEFCEKYNYEIVVSSTWRLNNYDYKTCLYNSGLRKTVKVVGATKSLVDKGRGDEISLYLKENNIKNYLIIDDDSFDLKEHGHRLIECDSNVGFTMPRFNYAVSLHDAFNK